MTNWTEHDAGSHTAFAHGMHCTVEPNGEGWQVIVGPIHAGNAATVDDAKEAAERVAMENGKPYRPEPPKLRPLKWAEDGRGGYYATPEPGQKVEIIKADDGVSWNPLWSLWINDKLIGDADEWRDPADAADEAMKIIRRDEATAKTAIRWGIPTVGLVALVLSIWVLYVGAP